MHDEKINLAEPIYLFTGVGCPQCDEVLKHFGWWDQDVLVGQHWHSLGRREAPLCVSKVYRSKHRDANCPKSCTNGLCNAREDEDWYDIVEYPTLVWDNGEQRTNDPQAIIAKIEEVQSEVS